MKVYKFRCKDCGSREYQKIEGNIYKCVYCGAKEEVIKNSEAKQFVKDRLREKQNVNDEKYRAQLNELKCVRSLFVKQVIALMLCVFAGTMGVHRFFQRKIFTGLLYLFTFGIFGIGWIVDILKLSFKLYDTSVEIKYLQNEIYYSELEREENLQLMAESVGSYDAEERG